MTKAHTLRSFCGHRVGEHAEEAVVDLSLVARVDVGPPRVACRGCARRGTPPKQPPEAREADRQALLVPQALVDRRDRVDPEHLFDPRAVGLDHRVGEAAARASTSSGHHARTRSDHCSSMALGRRAKPSASALAVLADRRAVDPETPGDLGLRPPGVPVQVDLDDVDHS